MSARTKWMTQSKFFNSGQPEGYEAAACDRCKATGQVGGSKCPKCAGHQRIYVLTDTTLVVDSSRITGRVEMHDFETEGRQDERTVTPCAVCGGSRNAAIHAFRA